MKKFIMLLLLLLAAFFIGCEGPVGPEGERGMQGVPGVQGVHGENAEVTVLTGVLPQSKDGYWEFPTSLNLKYCIITVNVRLNSEYAWFEPEWSYGSSTIWIKDVLLSAPDPGYEYLIKIAG